MIAFLAQGIALLHTETMLLIDDDQSEFLECHIVLNKGVCADRDHCLSSFQRSTIGGTFTCAHATSQEYCADAEWLKHCADTTGVLFGQEFSGGHDCTLEAIER